MAKQGMHKNDAHDPRVSPGRNQPKKSVPITAGTPKKRETYDAQARAHENTDPEPQHSEPNWSPDTRDPGPGTRIHRPASRRSGSDSNASSGTRGH